MPTSHMMRQKKSDVTNELLPQGAVVVVQSVPYASIYILECTMRLSKHYETCNKVVQGLPGPTKRTTIGLVCIPCTK